MLLASMLCAWAAGRAARPAIYFVRSDSIYEESGGKESVVVRHAVGPAPSPDGRRLAFLRAGDLYIFDLKDGATSRGSHFPVRKERPLAHEIFPSWDTKSQYVIFSHLDRYGVVREGRAPQPMFGMEHDSRSVWNVYWCWLSGGTPADDVSLFLGNETSGISGSSLFSSSSAAFSPDGTRVAFCRNGDLWMASVDPSSIHDAIHEAAWDEARVLACGIQEGGTRESTETSWIYRISWSPDGKLLALSTDRYLTNGSPEVRIVNPDNPAEKVQTFPGSDACFLGPGQVLYVKPYSKSFDIWVRDLSTRDESILVSHASEPAVAR